MKSLILTALFTILAGTATASNSPRAIWKTSYLDIGNIRGYSCSYAERAVLDILRITKARRIETRCYWNEGLAASWESLVPAPETADREALARIMGAALNAPVPAIKGGTEEIGAVWLSVQIQRQMNDARACNIYSDAYDKVLRRITKRNLQYQIFCNSGSGYIYLSFDYLSPRTAPKALPY